MRFVVQTFVTAIKISRRKSLYEGSRSSRANREQTCRVFVSTCLSAVQGFHRYRVGRFTPRSQPRSYIKISPRAATGETARKGEKRLLSKARVIRRPLRIHDSDRQRNDLRSWISIIQDSTILEGVKAAFTIRSMDISYNLIIFH